MRPVREGGAEAVPGLSLLLLNLWDWRNLSETRNQIRAREKRIRNKMFLKWAWKMENIPDGVNSMSKGLRSRTCRLCLKCRSQSICTGPME